MLEETITCLGVRKIGKDGIAVNGQLYVHYELKNHIGVDAKIFQGENRAELDVRFDGQQLCIARLKKLSEG